MSQSVKMPALGESVTEGTVTRWLKAEGDEVAVDAPLLEVSTDKVDTEIPSPIAGVLEKILVAEDETAEVGSDLALIGDGSGSGGDSSGDSSGDESADKPEPEPEAEPSNETPAETGEPSTETEAPAEKPSAETDSSDAADSDENTDTGDAEHADKSAAEGADKSSSKSSGKGGGKGTAVTLPAMGESVTEGTVTRWLKAVGDEVAVDEPLLEVSTDKVDTEVPSPVAGTLLEILVAEDETAEVGADLCRIGSADDAGGSDEPESDQADDADDDKAAESAASEASESDAPESDEPEPAASEQSADEATAEPKQEAPKDEAPQEEAPQADVSKQQTAETDSAETAAPQAQTSPAQASGATGTSSTGGAYVTPVIRKLAADNGVDLSTVTGTGVGGRIRREDVVAAAQAKQAPAEGTGDRAAEAGTPSAGAETPATIGSTPATAPDPAAAALIGTTQKTPRIRQAIAKNMVAALQTSAQLTSVIEVDVTRVAALRNKAKAGFEAREGVKLSFLPFFVKAAVEAAKQFPIINSSISEDLKEITYHPAVNLGIAVDTPRGLIVPVIKGADDLSLGGIARKIADLADRTRNNKIGPDELSGGTFTITNTGSVGALFDTAIFTPPQSAILVTGAVVKRPVVVQDVDGNESIAIRSMAYVALSYDHRTVDGADAARFLGSVKKRIEAGEFEGDLGL